MNPLRFLIPSSLLATLVPLSAASLTNGSFEDNFNSWEKSGNAAIKSAAPYAASQGTKLVAFNSGNTTGAAGIYQVLEGIEFGRSYRIDFDVGNFGYNPRPQKLEASVGGVWGTITYNLALAPIEIPGTTMGRTNWVSGSLTFTPMPVDAPLTVAFWDKSGYSDGLDLVLDNVRIREVTPSPLIFENGSFENGFAGWYVANTVGIRSEAPYRASDGTNLAVFDTGGPEIGSFIGRNLGTVPGQRYFLYFDMGTFSSNPNPRELAIVVGGNQNPDNSYLVFKTESIQGDGRGSITWAAKGYEFTAYSTATDLTFFETSGQSGAADLMLDHIRVIPAPPKGQFVNGSFEYGFDGWELNTTEGTVAIKSAPPYLPSDGGKLLAFNSANTHPGAYLTQIVDTIPGRTYQLVVDVGNLSYVPLPQWFRAIISDYPSGYVVQNEAVSIPSTSTSGGIHWLRNHPFTFTARGPQTRFLLYDHSLVTEGLDLVLDNVRLVPQ